MLVTRIGVLRSYKRTKGVLPRSRQPMMRGVATADKGSTAERVDKQVP